MSHATSETSPKIEKDERVLSEENYLLQAQSDKLTEDLKDQSQDRSERKKYGWIITGIVSVWLLSVLGVILISGFGEFRGKAFHLSEGVLLALLVTVTANIVGLFVMVIRYLFHRPNKIATN